MCESVSTWAPTKILSTGAPDALVSCCTLVVKSCKSAPIPVDLTTMNCSLAQDVRISASKIMRTDTHTRTHILVRTQARTHTNPHVNVSDGGLVDFLAAGPMNASLCRTSALPFNHCTLRKPYLTGSY